LSDAGPTTPPTATADEQLSTLDVPAQLDSPRTRSVSIDDVRAKLAYAMVGIFATTVAADIAIVVFGHLSGPDLSAAKDIFHELIPAETGLLGSAIGFYFAGQAKR
jgi:hypothetical protein